MVAPSASIGWVTIICTFEPEVTDATASEPSVLTALCSTTEPTAVKENCRPIGSPMARPTRALCGSNFHSSRCGRSTGKWRAM